MALGSLLLAPFLSLGAPVAEDPPAAPAAAEARRRHPADGPDVDLRIRIGQDKIVQTILMNLAFIDEVIEPVREDEDVLHPVEHEGVRLDLLDHFRATNKVVIDGVEVAPVPTGFEVGEPDLTLLPLFPRMGTKALIKVRLVLEYPTKAPPQRVTFVWPDYPDDINADDGSGPPPMTVIAQLTSKGLRSRIAFTIDEPEYTWHDTGASLQDSFDAVPTAAPPAELDVPMVSGALYLGGVLGAVMLILGGARRRRGLMLAVPALCIGGWLLTDVGPAVTIPDPFGSGPALPDASQALAVFKPLHANIYRAFDYVDEGDIYDALARSVDGGLLQELYTSVYRGLVLQEEGGAVCEVKAVKPLETSVDEIGLLPPDDAPGFTVVARWQVEGAVFHWGHSHSRTNEYQARYAVALSPTDGWRIRDQEILEQRTIATASTDPRAGGR